MEFLNGIDICSIVPYILILLGVGCIVLFFVLYSSKTRTQRAIMKHQKSSTLDESKEVSDLNENSDKNKNGIEYNKYLSEQIFFNEWNRRYLVIILAFFFGLILLSAGLFMRLFSSKFFVDFQSTDIFTSLIGVLTLIATIMIAVLQFVNQKHLRLLENSRQGNMSLLAKNEKLQEDIRRCFETLSGFYVYNFSNPDNAFLIKKIFEDTFDKTEINFNEISYLIAIPLEINLDFFNLQIEKIDVTVAVQGAHPDEISYKVKDNNIFIWYKKEHVLSGAVFHCLNEYSEGYRFNLSISLKSTETDMKAIVSASSSFSSLVYQDDPDLDGIYRAEIYSVIYKFK